MPKVRTTIETISLDGVEVAYQLARSPNRVKTISLSVDPELGLKLSVPQRMTDTQIKDFLVERTQWIRETQEKQKRVQPRKRDWSKGETIHLRGNPILVVVDDLPKSDRRSVVLTQRSLDGAELRILLPTNMSDAQRHAEVVNAIQRWYRHEAESHLPKRVSHWLPIWRQALRQLDIYQPDIDDVDPRVKISNARKRWGSCNLRVPQGVINLSWEVVRVPDQLADYIIIHELAHLKEMNHQPAFWNLVSTLIPDWQPRRKELAKWARNGVV